MKTAVQWSDVLADLVEVAAANDSAPAFFARLLSELSTAMEADAAACWMFDQAQSIGLLAEFQFSGLGLCDDLQGTRLNQRILSDTFSTLTARVVPFQVRNSSAITFVLLVPLVHKGNCIGVLEFSLEACFCSSRKAFKSPFSFCKALYLFFVSISL